MQDLKLNSLVVGSRGLGLLKRYIECLPLVRSIYTRNNTHPIELDINLRYGYLTRVIVMNFENSFSGCCLAVWVTMWWLMLHVQSQSWRVHHRLHLPNHKDISAMNAIRKWNLSKLYETWMDWGYFYSVFIDCIMTCIFRSMGVDLNDCLMSLIWIAAPVVCNSR